MKGIWLIQLGTPDAPTSQACRAYLKEFLSDPRVIDVPQPLRWLFVNAFILPFRTPKTTLAYQSVWRDEGSPLFHFSRKLTEAVQNSFPNAVVRLGMRYGNPSLQATWNDFMKAGVTEILVVPLYPQYAEASTGTALARIKEITAQNQNVRLDFLPPFFNDSRFIESVIAPASDIEISQMDAVLFSFHGLPERQIKKGDPYQEQCLETARLMAEALELPAEKAKISFQSRLGPVQWIRPFTDEVLVELARTGKKNIAVFCPSFVSDCLETLEEIGIRGRELFLEAGGNYLHLVPCINAHPTWIKNLSKMLAERL